MVSRRYLTKCQGCLPDSGKVRFVFVFPLEPNLAVPIGQFRHTRLAYIGESIIHGRAKEKTEMYQDCSLEGVPRE